MSTNYYLVTDVCDHCHRGGDKFHIGQYPSGLHGYHVDDWNGDRPPLTTWQQWKAYLLSLPPSTRVEDEYGRQFTPAEFIKDWEKTPYETRRKQYDWYVANRESSFKTVDVDVTLDEDFFTISFFEFC